MAPSPGKTRRQGFNPRGSNEVLGRGGGMSTTRYHPRAMWTGTEEHPLDADHAYWDGVQWLEDNALEEYRDKKMRQYLKDSLNHQMDERHDLRSKAVGEWAAHGRAVRGDVEKYRQEERDKAERYKQKAAEDNENRRKQVEAAQKLRQEQKEAAEQEARDVRAKAEQMRRYDDNKAKKEKAEAKAEQKRMTEALHQAEAEREEKNRKRIEEENKWVEDLKKQGLQIEADKKAKFQKLMDRIGANGEVYMATAGKANRQKEVRERRRQDRDEVAYGRRMDKLYSRREEFREAQRLDMVQTLAMQIRENSQRKQDELIQTQNEARAMEEDARRNLREDLRRHHARKNEQKGIQDELLEMMAEKGRSLQRAHYEANWSPAQERYPELHPPPPPPLLPHGLGSAQSGGGSGSLSMSKRMDASRFLTKPMGRVEVAPSMKRAASTGVLSMSMGIMDQDRRLEESPWRGAAQLRKSGARSMSRSMSQSAMRKSC